VFVIREPTRAQVLQQRLIAIELREGSRMVDRLALIAELDALGATRELGFRSMTHWLTAECRIEPRTARDYVRVAHRLKEWPRVRDALGEGRISYSQCRALTRASLEEDEAELLKVAMSSTVVALERHVRALRTAPSADLQTAERADERRSFHSVWDEDGSLKYWGSLGPVDGAALKEIVDAGATRIHAPQDDCGSRVRRPSLSARRADALAEIARSGCPRVTVMLHADLASLAAAAGEQGGSILHLRDGPAIPPELARRLTCDAMVTVAGLNHGRTQRVVSPAQRRALEERDGRVCWMPGCDCTHELDAHHIRHWSQGGRTDLDELILLCPYHHRLLHEGGWYLTREGNRISVRNPAGQAVLERQRPRRVGTRRKRPRQRDRTARPGNGTPRDVRAHDT
jgi:hypothetical protein